MGPRDRAEIEFDLANDALLATGGHPMNEPKTYACDQCHDPAVDRHLGFSPLLLGEYAAAKAHFLKVHGLFLAEDATTHVSSDASRVWHEKMAKMDQERRAVESPDAIMDMLKKKG